jgi:hypothetical protein
MIEECLDVFGREGGFSNNKPVRTDCARNAICAANVGHSELNGSSRSSAREGKGEHRRLKTKLHGAP